MRNHLFFDRLRSNPAHLFLHHSDKAAARTSINESEDTLPEILMITSYPPRECGIATYSADLKEFLDKKFGSSFHTRICAIDAGINADDYPDEVKFVLNTDDAPDYYRLAEEINADSRIQLVMIQHEFGLYRGESFYHFLTRLSKPVITVFHTVLPNPDDTLKNRVSRIVSLSDSVVVMTKSSEKILLDEYDVEPGFVSVIQHGTHIPPHQDKDFLRRKYDLEGRKVLSTFGLLGPGKGIETTLKALPEIIATQPDVIFLLLGKTHPGVVKHEGEKYRQSLEGLVNELGLKDHVRFVNKYLSLSELLEYLQLTDIYLFTSLDPNQAVSGTFSYAMSCGCPIISTPIPHAKEVLHNDSGVFIGFNDSAALAANVKRLLGDEELLASLSNNALHTIAPTSWDNSAVAHAALIADTAQGKINTRYSMPRIDLSHLKRMTTDLGMIQFAKFSEPDIESGYTLDDNARALITVLMHYEHTANEEDLVLAKTYLDFMEKCLQPAGYFLNYVDKEGEFTNQNNSVNLADSSGRAIWALGYLMHTQAPIPVEMKLNAEALLHRAASRLHLVHSTRAMAFAIKGLHYYNCHARKPEYTGMITMLAERMADMFRHETDGEWKWFESYLTYANGVLPEAMLCAYQETLNPAYKDIARRSFDFLLSKVFEGDCIRVISNRSWLHKNSEAERYGEQPIDVAYTILALARFYDVFGDSDYLLKMECAFSWFLGKNHLHQVIYNSTTGGCYDGLEENQVNLNQGAESTLSYLMARLVTEKYMHKAEKKYIHRLRETRRRLEVYVNYSKQGEWS